MAGTRRSARQAENASSQPSSQASNNAESGSKRKAASSPSQPAKRGKKAEEKTQQTLEESIQHSGHKEAQMEDVKTSNDVKLAEDIDAAIENSKETKSAEDSKAVAQEDQDIKDAVQAETEAQHADNAHTNGATVNGKENEKTQNGTETKVNEGAPAEKSINGHNEHAKMGEQGADDTSKMDDTGAIEPNAAVSKNGEASGTQGDAVEESSQREKSTPSSILEKGIIYFFFRGRVGINSPSDVNDLARSYIVLRPLPHGAKLGDGPIGDMGNNRLLALPKKVLPKSPRDRFMTFVEKANCSMEDIKNSVLASSDYSTKTVGTQHTPAATPIGEGVYAITTTGRESHLAYILTIPSEPSEVQLDIGLKKQGSFVTSTKNPQYAGPANTNLPKGPEFPKEYVLSFSPNCSIPSLTSPYRILEEFRSLRWAPLQPKYLNYENTQFLLIGSSTDDLGAATEQQPKDEKADKDTPLEEMEKLEDEDTARVEHLKGVY